MNYPCRCLCLLISQITRTTPLRRMILHFGQRGLTDGLTFIFGIILGLCVAEGVDFASKAESEATAIEIVRVEFDSDIITENDFDVMHSHFPGNARFQLMIFVNFVKQFDLKFCIREGFGDSSERGEYFFVGSFRQVLLFFVNDLFLKFEVSCHKK